ncbi:uncharacterized protein LOC119365810 isoform X2 [Triticum dicoccoides]|uniref:uncharacterized protein LOC119365810 isoform X2 n=1 Tax=Triticum dicoccoides TaxID=85692 RepID=UPI00188DD179|nr:uncharacterized protein LOC119365810 isoform X2 [Triticum dicoccoides]
MVSGMAGLQRRRVSPPAHPHHGRPTPNSFDAASLPWMAGPQILRSRILASKPTLHPRHGRPAPNSSAWDLRVGGMGSRPRWWPEEIQWCPGGSDSEAMALAIGGVPCEILPESDGLLRLFVWSRCSWSRPPSSPWCHTPPASLSTAEGTVDRCLLTAMARASTTGRRGPEPLCHSSPLRLLRPPRPSGHGRGGRRPGDRACRLRPALQRGHQLALIGTCYLNHEAAGYSWYCCEEFEGVCDFS